MYLPDLQAEHAFAEDICQVVLDFVMVAVALIDSGLLLGCKVGLQAFEHGGI